MSEKTWRSIHLYYSPPWQEMITNTVMPIVEPALATGLVEKFFFIRFWQRGPHLRLRFFGIAEELDSILIPNLKRHFEDFFEFKPSVRNDPDYGPDFPESEKWLPNNSLQEIPYQPEFYRYGGPQGMSIAENQFHHSSNIVFAKFKEHLGSWNNDQAIGTAITLHTTFVHAIRMDKMEAIQFFNMCFNNWLGASISSSVRHNKEKNLDRASSEVRLSFQRSFRAQKDMLVPFIKSLWDKLENGEEFELAEMNDFYTSQTTIGRNLLLLQADKGLKPRPERLQYTLEKESAYTLERQERWMHFADYVHLTNNRIGIKNRDEAYIAFILSECLERLL